MKKMKQIIKLIKKSKNVAVFGHQSPDGDCLGSISAISFLLENFGKKVDAFIDDDIHKRFDFMSFDNINQKEFDVQNYDLFISVDVAGYNLLGKYQDVFKENTNTIVIDHHASRSLCGKITYVDSQKSSCCEIIYELLKYAKIKPIKDIATKLYMGIVDDTGCFLHNNTTSLTHRYAGELIDLKADINEINYHLVKLIPKKNFEVWKLLDNEIIFDGGLTFIKIFEDFMQKNNFTKQDIGDYVNRLVNIENTKIAFVLLEKPNKVYSISLRSVFGYDVSHIAKQFGGGGHKQAAGGDIRENLDESIEKLVSLCKQEIKDKESDHVWEKWNYCIK